MFMRRKGEGREAVLKGRAPGVEGWPCRWRQPGRSPAVLEGGSCREIWSLSSIQLRLLAVPLGQRLLLSKLWFPVL